MLALGIALLLLTFLWVRSFEIVLTSESITYRTLWGGKRVLRLDDIKRAAVEMGNTEAGLHSRPMIRIALYPTKESGQDRLDINMKVFGLQEIQEVLRLLGLNKDDVSIVPRMRGRKAKG